ncbi:hypothetical protein FV139_01565 [Parahaliea maris]|uniref:RHS repeat-associated core domain-containing protein n=1 Tax=Parahaliea maris TaxID=2716870 RepID=A0A5C9A9F6_9GAMM|nr:RHS repeat-associated core domain-containing protein [Parahaliea maris]TXS96217.1 hypothetical protein FV139_01565 [Parahaliea maris]
MKIANKDVPTSPWPLVLALIIAPAQAADRQWSYTYNSAGQVLTTDGPRTDVTDLTRHTYDAQGNRTSTSNALDHQARMLNHNAWGKAELLIDANGVQTQLEYNSRGWLVASTVIAPDGSGNARTEYTYNNAGLLTATFLPNNVTLYNEYDAAHRLTAVANNRGERIEYTLDDAGNRLTETTRTESGTIAYTVKRTFDELNRVLTLAEGSQQPTNFVYDRNGNQIQVTDGKLEVTDKYYDALDRLNGEFAPLNKNALYAHNDQDKIQQVTDPRALLTDYLYDGFGNLLYLGSPDTGSVNYEYDPAGNLISSTDANGTTVSHRYDAINRITQTVYPDPALNITYHYDEGTYGIGRLTTISDASGNTALSYDHRGNLIQRSWDVESLTIDVEYTYNSADQLTTITYPSGRVVTYSRDDSGRVTSAVTATDSGSAPLFDSVSYLPYGPMDAISYGNGIEMTASFDGAYRPTRRTHAGLMDLSYLYDDNGNIVSIDDAITPASNQLFGYDALNRLTNAQGAYGSLQYAYDYNGNRLALTSSTGTDAYLYDSASHRLLETNEWAYQYDNNGNQIAKTSRLNNSGDGFIYEYGTHNRLSQVIERKSLGGDQSDTVLASYTYNALGQRAIKTTPQHSIHFVYDTDGKLLAEVRDDGIVLREYMYLENNPIAVAYTHEEIAEPTTGRVIEIDDESTSVSSTGNWELVRKKGALNDYYHRSENSGATFRWIPENLTPANYEVWAWWPKTRKNNPNASYSVVHNGRVDITQQDQSSLGKQWVLLGTYQFSGSGGEYVEIGDAGGVTAADGVKLVELVEPEPEYTTEVYFIHSDHLGSPRVITATDRGVLWRSDHKPFGEANLGTETIEYNLRFPGQYFDAESKLHHNYFRDFQPTTGRYVQSDPIGLQGGLNSYLYAHAAPTRYIDFYGLNGQMSRHKGRQENLGLTPSQSANRLGIIGDSLTALTFVCYACAPFTIPSSTLFSGTSILMSAAYGDHETAIISGVKAAGEGALKRAIESILRKKFPLTDLSDANIENLSNMFSTGTFTIENIRSQIEKILEEARCKN